MGCIFFDMGRMLTYGNAPMESNWSFRLAGDLWLGELVACSDLRREVGVSFLFIALFLAEGVFGIKPSILHLVNTKIPNEEFNTYMPKTSPPFAALGVPPAR